MTFDNLNLQPSILRSLKEQNYEKPSPIQEKAIPHVLDGKDLIACAQTGTGKTCAFSVPMIQILNKENAQRNEKVRKTRALILTPTRELAMQIFESLRTYARYTRIRSCVVYGGVSQRPQVQALGRGTDILVATPGRLKDLMNQGFVDLSNIEFFVLDEADRMLDMGFIDDVRQIVTKIPKSRQTLLFSATMPKEIENLAQSILNDPIKVVITPPATTVDAIEQQVYLTDEDKKTRLLAYLLKNPEIKSALVFTRTKHRADKVAKELHRLGIKAQAIHGDKSQMVRQTTLKNFKAGKTRVLIATDIAARGIDVDQLSHVFNYNLPDTPETYVHRIGRTGRAGHEGISIAFCDFNEKPTLNQIEKKIKKKISVISDHPFQMENFTPEIKNGGRKKFNNFRKNSSSSRPPRANSNYNKKQNFKSRDSKNSNSERAFEDKPIKKYNNDKSPVKKFKSVDEWIDKNIPSKPVAEKNEEIFDFARRSAKPKNNKRYGGNRNVSNKKRQG